MRPSEEILVGVTCPVALPCQSPVETPFEATTRPVPSALGARASLREAATAQSLQCERVPEDGRLVTASIASLAEPTKGPKGWKPIVVEEADQPHAVLLAASETQKGEDRGNPWKPQALLTCPHAPTFVVSQFSAVKGAEVPDATRFLAGVDVHALVLAWCDRLSQLPLYVLVYTTSVKRGRGDDTSFMSLSCFGTRQYATMM